MVVLARIGTGKIVYLSTTESWLKFAERLSRTQRLKQYDWVAGELSYHEVEDILPALDEISITDSPSEERAKINLELALFAAAEAKTGVAFEGGVVPPC